MMIGQPLPQVHHRGTAVLGTSPATFNLIIHALAPVLATANLVMIALRIQSHFK